MRRAHIRALVLRNELESAAAAPSSVRDVLAFRLARSEDRRRTRMPRDVSDGGDCGDDDNCREQTGEC